MSWRKGKITFSTFHKYFATLVKNFEVQWGSKIKKIFRVNFSGDFWVEVKLRGLLRVRWS